MNRWPSNWQVENGQNGVIWKTTGTANDGTKRDIEIPQGANANGQGANNLGETLRNYCFAYMPEGNQCAELNCEASGALYQDVITIPGTQMYWSLYHRARGAYDKWKLVEDKTQNRETDTMYVVAMPKDLAEKYDVTTQEKVLEIKMQITIFTGQRLVQMAARSRLQPGRSRFMSMPVTMLFSQRARKSRLKILQRQMWLTGILRRHPTLSGNRASIRPRRRKSRMEAGK